MSKEAVVPAGLEGTGFRALTELSPDVIAVIDLHGTIRYASPAVQRIMGYPPAEVIGRVFLDFVHPDDQATGRADLEKLRQSSDIVASNLRFRHKDGSLRMLETLGRNYGETPGLQGVLVSARDITQRAAEEQALRGALSEANDLYNNAPCGYQSLDENGVYLRVNDTELRWLGRTREEIVGKARFLDLLAPRSRALFERQFAELKRLGRIDAVEVELQRGDGGTVPVLLSATAALDEHGRFVMSREVLYDITERKHAESALRKMNRARRVLSAATAELFHAEAEPALLQAICRVCVELGGYRMAWVGFAQNDLARSVRPMAQSGFDEGYLERAGITWDEGPRGSGPTGTAIRTGAIQVNQNVLTNPRMAPWREDALGRGYQSSIALPLKGASGPLGALMIYAAEPGAFDPEEVRLLQELAGDLEFGIATLRAREQHRRAEQHIERLAFLDDLTGLPNRNRLMDALAQAAEQFRSGRGPFALLVLRIARFGEIQAAIGLKEANAMLQQLAARLKSVLRENELLARTGDDEFAVLLDRGGVAEARECGARIDQAVLAPFQRAGIPVSVPMRIGAAVASGHGLDPDVLLLRSGIAARRAESAGSGFELYDSPTESESPRYLALISELRAAIEAKQLVLQFQPKVDLGPGRISGVEALVRWQHPERGLITPDEFIGLAEHTDLMGPLTDFVLDAALRQSRLWSRQGFAMSIAVNVSVNNFSDPRFPGRLESLLKKWDVSPGLLQIEITETTLMEEPARTHDLLARLRDLGVLVSLDDFGTGYSSLNYFASLPIHALKIDRSFVARMLEFPRTHSVVAATISLARSLSLRTVAEGVESKAQAEALAGLGCTELQGFYFSRPLDAEPLRQWAAGFSLESFGIRAQPR